MTTDAETARLLELDDLTVSYGSFHALKGITVSMEGGAVGLLGPNGAGKSTLIRTLLGLKGTSNGSGRIFGYDIVRERLEIRKRTGYSPEHDCHIPGMNGFEYVAYCGRLVGMPYRDARRRAHEVLEYVGLGEERYRLVDSYSTGQRQRVKLAQTLVHDPSLVILDEPTNGFDPRGREDVLDLIRDISHNKEIHLLLSSHLLKDVERTCDFVILLKDGKMIRSGRISDLKTPEQRSFDLEIRGDPGILAEAAGKEGWRYEPMNGRVSGRLFVPSETTTSEIFRAVAQAGLQLRQLSPTEESLEDLFMKSVEE